MIYTDYEFYRNNFGGDRVPAEAFERFAARASKFIEKATFNRIRAPDESVQSCCCELAELFYKQNKNGGAKQSESIGGYSYTLAEVKSSDDEMLDICRLWLPPELMYRGVGKC